MDNPRLCEETAHTFTTVPPARLPYAVIADDFTGGNDTGLQFHKAGLQTLVCIASEAVTFESAGRFDVLVFDTESRNCNRAKAYEKVMAACRRLPGQQLVYKKVDSTLRGNLRAELDAVMQALGLDLCLMAPAFPEAGRTIIGGYHLVHGVPLELTETAHDPVRPVRTSFVPDLLEGSIEDLASIGLKHITKGPEELAREIVRQHANNIRLFVLDAASDNDLRIIAAAACRISPHPLLCGSAGLARHVPSEFGLLRTDTPEHRAVPTSDRPVLAIAGSLSDVTRTQVAVARKELNAYLLELRADDLMRDDPAALSAIVGKAEEALRQGRDAMIVLTRGAGADLRSAHRRITGTLGAIARATIRRAALSGLLLTGGDTAVAVVLALGACGTRIVDEIQSGVPACSLIGGDFDGIRVVTKAGGFGDPYAIVEGIRYLKGSM